MSEADGKKLKKLLHNFVVRECESGVTVPQEVTSFLLGDLVVHASLPEDSGNDKFEEFVDSFEQYIHGFIGKRSGSKIKQRKNTKVRCIDEILPKFQNVVSYKKKEANEVFDNLKQLFDLKFRYHKKIENLVNAKQLLLEGYDMRVQILNCKVTSFFLNETRFSKEAFIKLQSLIDKENKEVNKRLEVLEDKEMRYCEVENVKEYQAMLVSYKKLSVKKEALAMAEAEGLPELMSTGFSFL